MKNKKKFNYLLLGTSVLGALAIIAGSTAAVTSSIYNNKEKNNANNNETKQNNAKIASALSNYITNPIVIVSSTITSNNAILQSNSNLIKSLIINGIKTQLNGNKISIGNSIYTEQELLNNINIQLPDSVSYIDYLNGWLSNVTLSYGTGTYSVVIHPNNGTSYTVQGFAKPSTNNPTVNKNIANKLTTYIANPIQISDKLTASNALNSSNQSITISLIKNAIAKDIGTNFITIGNVIYSAQTLINNLNVILPTSVSSINNDYGTLSGVVLSYGSGNNSVVIQTQQGKNAFNVIGFLSTTNSKNTNNSSISQDIASKLGSLIKNPIALANGYNLTAAQSIETSSNQQTLSTAIKEAISNEINSTTITINDKVYQVSKLISNINITLPDQVSNQNNNSGILENVTLSYNGYNIENASNSNLYEVTNLAIPSSQDQDNQNNAVATYLNSLLNQIIQLDNPTYSQDYANQALILNPVSLKKAIINAIGLEITNQISDFPINNIYYSISDIKQNLNVTLPTNISENDEKNGQISNVNLYYKNIELSNTSNTNNFIVQGFKTTTLQNILNQPTSSTTTGSNQNNKTIKSNIISQLNNELNQYINVQGYINTTATSALSNENSLDNAIISSLQKEITSFTFNNIVFEPQDIFNTNTLTIKIPSSNAIIDNGQEISNVTIYFENSQLSNTQGQYFIVGSFKEETSQVTSVSQQIANKLDSLLSNIINVAQYDSMDTYTAAEALNNQATDSLTNAIISAIKSELGTNSIQIDNNSYSINEIANELKVSLPSSISLTDDENAQIPGVTLSYDNISLTWNTNSSSSSNSSTSSSSSSNTQFIVEGFAKASATQAGYNPGGKGSSTNRNHQIAKTLDSSLSQIINVANYDSMNSITAQDALNNQTSDNLKQAITTAIQNEIGSDQLTFDGLTYTASEIANNITITLPLSITSTDNQNAQIPGVTLSYNGISLSWNNSSSNSSTTSSSSSSNTDFIIEGFSHSSSNKTPSPGPSNNQPITDYYNQIAKKLDAELSNIINISSDDFETGKSSSNTSINNNLITAVKAALQLELQDLNATFSFNGETYTIKEVVSNINVILPSSSSDIDTDIQQGTIPGVQLKLGSILLTNTAKTNEFTIQFIKGDTGKKIKNNITQSQIYSEIANQLNDILSNIINVNNYNNVYANSALSSESAENLLTSAVQSALTTEIQNSGTTFSFTTDDDNITYSATQIVQDIMIQFPASTSLTETDINDGQIPGVILEFEGILLNNTEKTNTFIIKGFKTNTTPIKKISVTTEAAKYISNQLDNLLSNDITVSGYEQTTASDALGTTTTQNALLQAIKTALLQEIQGSGLTFSYDAQSYTISYTPQQIVDNINVILPTGSLSSSNNSEGQIPGVTLTYEDITLLNTSDSWNFTIVGFLVSHTVKQKILQDQEIAQYIGQLMGSYGTPNVNVSNISALSNTLANTWLESPASEETLTTYIKPLLIQFLIKINNDHDNFVINNENYTAADLVNNITFTYPDSIPAAYFDTLGTMCGIGLKYNGFIIDDPNDGFYFPTNDGGDLSATFLINGFELTTSDQNWSNQNTQMVTKLNSILNNIIEVNGYSNTTASSSISTTPNQNNLMFAIQEAIYNEISKSFTTIVINHTSYTLDDIVYGGGPDNYNINLPDNPAAEDNYVANLTMSGILITLPKEITLDNTQDGLIPDVSIQYNGLPLTNIQGDSTFTITGFAKITSDKVNKTVATWLDTILPQIINVTGFSDITASDALTSPYPSKLKTAIKNLIEQEIINSKYKLLFDNVSFSADEIIQGLSINLPVGVTLNDEEKGMMSNVTIQYENIPLSNDDSTNTSPTSFIVEGFKEVSNTSTTEQIISTLNTILNQVINVTGYSDVTAADALTNPTSLESSIRTALNTEITNSKETFNFNDQFTSIQDIVNALVINLPSSITLTNDKQAQIPDVIITYNGIQLSNEQDATSFIVEGFEQTTANSIGSTGSPTSRNQQIASLLDSLLNPIIQIEAYSKIIASDSISDANNQSLLTSSIETSLANEISNWDTSFIFNNVAYTVSEIIANIKVTLPNSVPIASDVLGQMPDVTLSYAGINLINSNNTSDFTVEGFEITSRSNIENSANISSKIANQVELWIDKIMSYFTNSYWTGYSYDMYFDKYNSIFIPNVSNMTASQAENVTSDTNLVIRTIRYWIVNNWAETIPLNETFTFNNITYTTLEIINNLDIFVPQYTAFNSDGKITGVTFQYNYTDLTFSDWSIGTSGYTSLNIWGFEGYKNYCKMWYGLVGNANPYRPLWGSYNMNIPDSVLISKN